MNQGYKIRFNPSDTKAFYHGFLYAIALCFAAIFGSVVALGGSANAQNTQQTSKQNQVSLSSKAFIVRTEQNADGSEKTVLKTPQEVVVVPGDRLKFILTYTNATGEDVTGFKATNPMPASVQFIEAAEDWAQVSVDGGTTWGKLSDLTVESLTQNIDAETSATSVNLAATSADVTHVRWVFDKIISTNESGSVSFEGFVK